MLRFLSGRCVGAASVLNCELRVVNYCSAQKLTSFHHVSKPLLVPLHKTLSTQATKNTDASYAVVYNGKLERDIIRVKLFSLTTSVMGLVFQPILYNQASSLPVLIATCSVAGFFTFVTPVLLHQLAKRYVNRITYNKDKDNYIAHTTTFFFRQKQIPIEPGEAKVPDHGGMFTSIEVRGIPLMVEMEGFDKSHLIRLLGYDKPLDIEHERLVAHEKKAEEQQEVQEFKESQEQILKEVEKQRRRV